MLKLLIVACALGLASAMPDPYVLYGRTASQGQFPFAAWLGSCSASILDSRTVLTAGHCVCRSKPTSVLFGAVQGNNPESGSRRYSLDTSRQVIHPRYTSCGTIGKDDIAILKTTTAISFTSVIGAITLHTSATSVGQSITIAGYGQDENRRSGVLKYATSTVESCRRFIGAVCQSMSPNSPYYGDSGGPLFITVSGQPRQVGVVSGGDFSNNQAIYGNVATAKTAPPQALTHGSGLFSLAENCDVVGIHLEVRVRQKLIPKLILASLERERSDHAGLKSLGALGRQLATKQLVALDSRSSVVNEPRAGRAFSGDFSTRCMSVRRRSGEAIAAHSADAPANLWRSETACLAVNSADPLVQQGLTARIRSLQWVPERSVRIKFAQPKISVAKERAPVLGYGSANAPRSSAGVQRAGRPGSRKVFVCQGGERAATDLRWAIKADYRVARDARFSATSKGHPEHRPVKVMHVTFFDREGLLFDQPVPVGQTVNGDFYLSVLSACATRAKVPAPLRSLRPRCHASNACQHERLSPFVRRVTFSALCLDSTYTMLKLIIVACALGVASALPDPYVLYGQTAEQGQFPFAGWLGFCSASILDRRTVLTAGHCVCRTRPTSVLFGAVQGNRPESGSKRYSLDTSRQVINPKYTQCNTVGKDDIAIVKTTADIEFTDLIKPIVLYEAATSVGQSVTIAGYGQDENRRSGVLKYATSTVESCRRFIGAVCQSMSPNSPYYGDSGGPLFITVSGQPRQVGVVSGGDFSNNQAIYGNVYDNLSFLKANFE
uniref:Peptidase S1 domain-containing protein n=1 Tax=Macrostomum lignano TaxID=282301 RepID=A0A1I8G8Y9_9PLAT